MSQHATVHVTTACRCLVGDVTHGPHTSFYRTIDVLVAVGVRLNKRLRVLINKLAVDTNKRSFRDLMVSRGVCGWVEGVMGGHI